jgi:hypothetical protein
MTSPKPASTAAPSCREIPALVVPLMRVRPPPLATKTNSNAWMDRDPDHNCQFFQCPLPYGCHALDSCYLVDLTTIPVTEQWLDLTSTSTYRLSSSSSPNGSGKKKKKFSIRCTVVEPIDRLTFYYPNGVKDRHIERFAPYYMRGDNSTTGRIYQVPYLQEGSGCNETKSWTVEGMKGSKVCFNQTVELTAIC